MRKKYKNYRLNSSGFSLIEIMVAMSIFALIVGGIVLFSVRTIQAHTKAQAMQNAIDNARFAIESLNKKIRTSHDTNNNTEINDELIYIIDNVDATKFCYRFSAANETLEMSKLIPTDAAYNAANDCGGGFPAFSDLVGGGNIDVTGNFFIKETDEPANDRGFVCTIITIQYDDSNVSPAERDTMTIQSSVSVRDY